MKVKGLFSMPYEEKKKKQEGVGGWGALLTWSLMAQHLC